MGEAVVSVALEIFRDLLLEEARFLSGVGDEVKALQTQLQEMMCLLRDADSRQHESQSVSNWIAQIRDLAYKAEDAIETYAVKVSSKRGRGLKRLLRRFACIMKECYSLHQIGGEILQIKYDLEAVKKSMQSYGIRSIIRGEDSHSSSTNDNQKWKRQTFPDFKIEDCFMGKHDELKQIVSLLVDDEHQHQRVVSIWGMGGLGKTTIARKAYHHNDTKRHFQSFAWVCISKQCNIRSVLEDVLKQLKRDAIPNLSDTELIQQLCLIQKANNCIIVLDDLWETDHWDGLKHAFLVEGLRTKILVTTRKQTVAEIGFPVKLGLLTMDSGWELLEMKAYLGTHVTDNESDKKLMEKIGKEMVQKCGFLPLTICLLGGVLSKRKSVREWELVKENINAYLYRSHGVEKENTIQAVLKLSYEDLPYYLKPCFLYLGLYKEDEMIYVSNLYKMWVAHGMISHWNQEGESLLVIAELFLSELASRSIVQVHILDDEDVTLGKKYTWCKLHDAVRELCLSMGKQEGFGLHSLDYLDGTLMNGSSPDFKARHLAIYFEGDNDALVDGERDESAISSDEETYKYVRSLVLNSIKKKNEFPHIAIDLSIFKLLRVLLFLRLKFKRRKLPEGVGNLIHLRYLGFDDCELDELPPTIGNLSNLQTLDLKESWNIRVPNVLNKLLRLKHLMLPSYADDIVRDVSLELDKGLHELETLTGFDSFAHRLESITKLKNLQTLAATLRDNRSLSAVIDSIITKWNKLKTCSLYILKDCEFTSTEGLMVLKKVFTCPKLHELGIYVEIGKRLVECRNQVISARIVRLYLWECKITDDPMDILGKLPTLRELFLWVNSFLGEEMTCSAFSFPRLTKLVLEKLSNLKKWRIEEGAMPLLNEIKMEYCPNLMMLPDGLRFISSLQTLIITVMPNLVKRVLVSKDWGGVGGQGEGEDFHKVRHVPSIIINN